MLPSPLIYRMHHFSVLVEDERHADTITDVALKSCLWTQLLSLSIGFASSFMYKLLDNINGLTTIYRNIT